MKTCHVKENKLPYSFYNKFFIIFRKIIYSSLTVTLKFLRKNMAENFNLNISI